MTTKNYGPHNNYGCSPGQDGYKNPGADIVGQITVRANESFWVRKK